MMDENAAGTTKHLKMIQCPGCGQELTLELQLNASADKLYAWFEGMCDECCHKIVDPMPRMKLDTDDVAGRIVWN